MQEEKKKVRCDDLHNDEKRRVSTINKECNTKGDGKKRVIDDVVTSDSLLESCQKLDKVELPNSTKTSESEELSMHDLDAHFDESPKKSSQSSASLFCSPFSESLSSQDSISSSPTKRSKTFDKISDIQAVESGVFSVQANVIEKLFCPEMNTSLLRLASENHFIDLSLSNKEEVNGLEIGKTYNFINIQKLENVSHFTNFHKSIISRSVRGKVAAYDIPPIKLSENLSKTSLIKELSKRAREEKNGQYDPTGTLNGIVMEVNVLNAKTEQHPTHAITVYDSNGDKVCVKLWSGISSQYNVEKGKSYSFCNFRLKINDYTNEFTMCSGGKYCSINSVNLDFHLPEKYDNVESFIIGIKLNSLRIYRLCGLSNCEQTQMALKQENGQYCCPKCKNVVPEKYYMAGFFVEMMISENAEDECGELIKLFNDSALKLLNLKEKVSFVDAMQNGNNFYEKMLEGKVWNVKGFYGQVQSGSNVATGTPKSYNITSAKIVDI